MVSPTGTSYGRHTQPSWTSRRLGFRSRVVVLVAGLHRRAENVAALIRRRWSAEVHSRRRLPLSRRWSMSCLRSLTRDLASGALRHQVQGRAQRQRAGTPSAAWNCLARTGGRELNPDDVNPLGARSARPASAGVGAQSRCTSSRCASIQRPSPRWCRRVALPGRPARPRAAVRAGQPEQVFFVQESVLRQLIEVNSRVIQLSNR